MNDDTQPEETPGYEPPTIVRLGTLTELTQGGSGPIDDGIIGSGDQGSA